MQRRTKKIWWVALFLALVALLPLSGNAAEEEDTGSKEVTMSITGTVNDTYQIVTDQGVAYEIGVTDAGDELVMYPGRKATAHGKVEENDDQKIIYVDSYKLGSPE